MSMTFTLIFNSQEKMDLSPKVASVYKEVADYQDLLLLGDLPTISQEKRPYSWISTAPSLETKEPRHSYCQAFYYNNPHKLMPDQTKRTLLKAAAHTGQCTPTHLH